MDPVSPFDSSSLAGAVTADCCVFDIVHSVSVCVAQSARRLWILRCIV